MNRSIAQRTTSIADELRQFVTAPKDDIDIDSLMSRLKDPPKGTSNVGDPYYHTAPTADRDRILQHGLQPSAPQWSPTWGADPVANRPNEGLATQPTGVYMGQDDLTVPMRSDLDLWKIDPKHIDQSKLQPDHQWSNAVVYPTAVDPKALSLRPDIGAENEMWKAQRPEQAPMPYDDHLELANNFADAEQNRQQGNPWGIGQPVPDSTHPWVSSVRLALTTTTGWKSVEKISATVAPYYDRTCPGCNLRVHDNGWSGKTGIDANNKYYPRSQECPECGIDWRSAEGRPVPVTQTPTQTIDDGWGYSPMDEEPLDQPVNPPGQGPRIATSLPKSKIPISQMTPEQVAEYKAAQEYAKVGSLNWLRDNPRSPDNIVSHWNQTTPEHRDQGMSWYQDAHYAAQQIARDHGITTNQAAGLIANYSPQQHWATNLEMASRAAAGQIIGGPKQPGQRGFMASRSQADVAQRLLRGEDYHGIFGGKKITSFGHLIEHGQDTDVNDPNVVVDRHALGVAHGGYADDGVYTHSKVSTGVRKDGSSPVYDDVANMYKQAADTINANGGHNGIPIQPHQLQAATWLTRQRLNTEGGYSADNPAVANRIRKVAEASVNNWNAYAAENHPSLVGKTPGTGFSAYTGAGAGTPESQPQPQQPDVPNQEVWGKLITASQMQKTADNYAMDSRNFPDPTAPRAAKPPEPLGCTCQEGQKLHCPVHGMDATESDNDSTWSVPQAQPIGFSQDAPRSWQQAHASIVSTRVVSEPVWKVISHVATEGLPRTIETDWKQWQKSEVSYAHTASNQDNAQPTEGHQPYEPRVSSFVHSQRLAQEIVKRASGYKGYSIEKHDDPWQVEEGYTHMVEHPDHGMIGSAQGVADAKSLVNADIQERAGQRSATMWPQATKEQTWQNSHRVPIQGGSTTSGLNSTLSRVPAGSSNTS
jgi:hypothetical protein